MSVDSAPLAKATAELMDELERTYGEDALLAGCVLVAEVRHAFTDEGHRTEVHAAEVDCGLSAAVGILCRGADALLNPENA